MDETKAREKQNSMPKQDSYKIGTASKSGAISVYFDVQGMTDEELKTIIKRANGLYKYALDLG